MQTILLTDWKLVEYGTAWEQQEAILKTNLELKAAYNALPEDERAPESPTTHHLILCSHPAVYTLGKSGSMENLLANDSRLADLNATFYKTNRGGDITFHGPGQIVGYPILDLEKFFTDLGKYMRSLEEVIIKTIAFYGIKGERLPGSTGVWLDVDDPRKVRKICAMGVRCSRWITMHGFALNVNTDMRYFDYMIPCGIADKGVTSLHKELAHPVDEAEVKALIRRNFEIVFGAELVAETTSELIF